MSYFSKGKYGNKPVSLKSIREHRQERGMSQLELSQATHLRIPQGLLSELERGTRRLTSWTAPLIADVFEVGTEDLILGNNLALLGVKHSDRYGILKTAVKNKNRDLIKAVKSIIKLEVLDFGDRDSFGRKLDKEQIASLKDKDSDLITRDSFGRKRSEKVIKERRREAKKSKEKDFDFGNRDSFGRKLSKKQIAMKRYDDFDDLDLTGLNESEKLLARLNKLLEKGEERR